MGSAAFAKALPFPLTRTLFQSLRCFSLSATNGVVYPQFSHAPQGSTAIGATDFIFRHGFNDGPFAAFKTGRLAGLYRRDPRQERVVLKLQELHGRLDALNGHRGTADSGLTVVENVPRRSSQSINSNWYGESSDDLWGAGMGVFSGIASLMTRDPSKNGLTKARPARRKSSGSIRGLYLYGGVGVGKTMLMDMFVATKPTNIKVNRTHFHDFMLGIHASLKEQAHKPDPLTFVAESLSAEARVLALDEFFVTDVADAMIIDRLFKTLWEREMILIATSNRQPDDLYLGGLQRDLFLPFIESLKDMCVVHDMESEVDYRKLARHNKGIYFTNDRRNQCLLDAFNQKTMGRKLQIPLASGAHCYFTFEELCGKPVGSADYLGLCRSFHTVFIQDIPIITNYNKPAAYRLVTLIDILYDNRIRVLCSAVGKIEELFKYVISHAESVQKAPGQEEWVVDDTLSFAKERTISRLNEMESMEYLVEHANRHAPELLLALAEAEEQQIKLNEEEEQAVAVN